MVAQCEQKYFCTWKKIKHNYSKLTISYPDLYSEEEIVYLCQCEFRL